jgi:hypothetical protein
MGGINPARKALMDGIGQGQGTYKQWSVEHRDNITACNEMWNCYLQVRIYAHDDPSLTVPSMQWGPITCMHPGFRWEYFKNKRTLAKGRAIQKEVQTRLSGSGWEAAEGSKENARTSMLNLVKIALGDDAHGWTLGTIMLMEEMAQKVPSGQ